MPSASRFVRGPKRLSGRRSVVPTVQATEYNDRVGALKTMRMSVSRYRKYQIATWTKIVGEQLFYEAKQSPELKHLLETHRYVFIDGEGHVVGTNHNRILGVGRMRLDSRKVLSGEYIDIG